jgi:cell division protease FtsH
MNPQLLRFVTLVLIVLLVLTVASIFEYPGGPRITLPAPLTGAQWFLSLLISWLPFIFLAGVWIFLMRRVGRTAFGTPAAPTGAMLDDPAYWRGRADASRALSERLADMQSKRQMLEIVRGYEYLAQRAEERRRGPGTPA